MTAASRVPVPRTLSPGQRPIPFAVKAIARAVAATLKSARRRAAVPRQLAAGICAVTFGVTFSVQAAQVEVDLPAQPLSDALRKFSTQVGVGVAFESDLVAGKQAPEVKGRLEPRDALNRLLADSGLEGIVEGDTAVIARKQSQGKKPPIIVTDTVKVRAQHYLQVGPMPGLALTKEQIAGNIQSLTAEDIKKARSLSISDLMNTKLQSVNVNDYQSNPFQMDVTYRGFTASPQIGTPQGLSVFFDGIRVNEPFGDVVNWDMIPMNALEGMDVFPGSNPLFGLNTLGGALAMRTKSGFTSEGVSAEILAGSFGRRQLQASAGWNNGDTDDGGWDTGSLAAFGAVNLFLEDGWRDNSPSRVNQAFGKLEWQGERASLSFSTLAAVNKLRGNGTLPQELYREDPASVFTSPDETRNRLLQFQVSGAFDISDSLSLTGHVYKRESRRKSSTGDMIDFETFSNADHSYHMYATRLPGAQPGLHCGYADSDSDGIPNYYVLPDENYIEFSNKLGQGVTDYSLLSYNTPLPTEVAGAMRTVFESGVIDGFVNPYVESESFPYGLDASFFVEFGEGVQYYGADGKTYRVFAAPPINAATCQPFNNQGMLPSEPNRDRDGNSTSDPQPGVVEGTPTAIITNSDIDQSSHGAALQLNWNLDQHKLMVGASVDKSSASYVGKQRLALLDEQRNVYSDPSQLGEEFWAGSHDVTINDFDGTSETKSLYFSENWAPTQNLNLSFSARYNHTDVENHLAPSIGDSRLENLHLLNRYVNGVICPGGELANCPYQSGPIPADVYWDELILADMRKQIKGGGAGVLDKRQSEAFSYHSLNPALGVTWQARPSLNLYANWNQGTRAPSVVELGCAYDDTLVPIFPGSTTLRPRSLVDGRGCKLPSALSGDPYLPQVVAQTAEIGARGKFKDFIEWNVSAYRTDVKDDIYMTSLTNELSFFQSIGDTRRQGIEFGLAGEYGKSDFRLNYSLTEATFQSFFKMLSPYNSSRGLFSGPDMNMIQVQPGNVMPGVPFNNLNLGWGYQLTPRLKLNFNLVAHSRSYLRGNENNAHTPGEGRTYTDTNGVVRQTPDNQYSGTAPGYAVLNFHGSYDLGKGWMIGATINNLLDKEYYTAGRLGLNPFAPSTIGAIGPGGFNYNSSEWISSQFISPGAPRGVWLSLSYDFDAAKRSDPPPADMTLIEPDRTQYRPDEQPTADELALMRRLDRIKALPLLKRAVADAATLSAEQEVTARVEAWRKALAEGDAQAYLDIYAAGYAPGGVSHNDWAEQQKLQLATQPVQSVEMSGLVVAAQGERLVAVFQHKLVRGPQAEAQRKVLSFEQKDGAWRIVQDHALPAGGMAAKPARPAATQSRTTTPAQAPAAAIKTARAASPAQAEEK